MHFAAIRLFYTPLEETAYRDHLKPWGGLDTVLVLPYDQNNVGFELSGIDQINPEKVSYQWKLEGLETEWSPYSSRSEVNYAGLQPGAYRFLVRARNDDGVESPEPLVAAILIQPPFWATRWFRWTIVLTFFLLIGTIFYNILHRERRKAKARQEALLLENKLLQLEQKARQLQMNPHFIFNALNSIQSLVSKEDLSGARHYLSTFARMLRSTLKQSQLPQITLEDELKTLQQYLEMEQFCRGGKFDFFIRTEALEDISYIVLPPMILQPFVVNAILHGMDALSSQGKIEVSLTEAPEYIQIAIRDNGIGRQQAGLRSKNAPGHESSGIRITRERLEQWAIQHGMPPEKVLEITDLTDENGKDSGTEVLIRLPWS